MSDPVVSPVQEEADVYGAFIAETDALMPFPADMRAVHLLGVLTRAVKRAQMVVDGELPPISERLERVRDYLR